mmetsp:Transcript_1852/g.4076  ORF Transcript_1852/g.4076 Transcript_1852/m.4076 type:complete len:195 (-) Transcript_1852:36-620(-)
MVEKDGKRVELAPNPNGVITLPKAEADKLSAAITAEQVNIYNILHKLKPLPHLIGATELRFCVHGFPSSINNFIFTTPMNVKQFRSPPTCKDRENYMTRPERFPNAPLTRSGQFKRAVYKFLTVRCGALEEDGALLMATNIADVGSPARLRLGGGAPSGLIKGIFSWEVQYRVGGGRWVKLFGYNGGMSLAEHN